MEKFEKLHLLESKITKTVARFAELNDRYEELAAENKKLADELTGLRTDNSKLSEQVVELQAARVEHDERAIDEKKILNKIDRMLEKFGELQI